MSLFANGIEGIPAAPQAATRACHICGSTEHLKKDCPQAGGGGRSNKLCHICGKPGHLKKDCPDAGNALADGVADLSVAPKAARKKRVMCYNCGQIGHVSAECTMPRQEGATFRKCFNCGKPGHVSADCPQPQGNQNCYECGQPGHKARDCPNVQ